MVEDVEDQAVQDAQQAALERVIREVIGSGRVIIDFDVIALAGLTAAIYQLNPQKVQEAFNAQLTSGFAVIAEGFGNIIEGGGEALGDFWKWLIGSE